MEQVTNTHCIMAKSRSTQITLRPWAKINLYLKVLGKRNDGYHKIFTFIHPIGLFDELIIKRIQEGTPSRRPDKIGIGAGLIVNCRLEGLPDGQDIPPQEDNIITKAVRLFFKRIGENPSVEINLVKRIPIGGGLGGGSSDAASTITGLNKLFGYPLSDDILYKICLELGMDVPFFLEPKPALCIGRGEIIEKRFKRIKFFCVLVNPGKSLTTKSVYEKLILNLTEAVTTDNIFRFTAANVPGMPGDTGFLRAFRRPKGCIPVGQSSTKLRTASAHTGVAKLTVLARVDPKDRTLTNIKDISEIAKYIENDLEGPAINLYPEIGSILELLRKAGAIKSFVCGSGSTVCGLVSSRREAEEVIEKVRGNGSKDWWVRVVSSL